MSSERPKQCPRCLRLEPPTEAWEWYPWAGVVDVCGECADDMADVESKGDNSPDCSDYLGYGTEE